MITLASCELGVQLSNKGLGDLMMIAPFAMRFMSLCRLNVADPCIGITTTTLAGIICLGVLIVEVETKRSSSITVR